MDDVITLDSDDEATMEVDHQQGQTMAVENHPGPIKNEIQKSAVDLQNENLSFFDFKPFSAEFLDEETFDNEEEDYDPFEELEIDDIEKCKPLNYNFGTTKNPKKIVYSHENDSVNNLLNSMPNGFKMDQLMDQLPEDFVKMIGGRHAAYIELSLYVKEIRHEKSYDSLFEVLIDLAKKAGATEEEIERYNNMTDPQSMTAKIKCELWDNCLQDAVNVRPEDDEVIDGLDEDSDVEELISTNESPPIEELISSKAVDEPECIVIDDD